MVSVKKFKYERSIVESQHFPGTEDAIRVTVHQATGGKRCVSVAEGQETPKWEV